MLPTVADRRVAAGDDERARAWAWARRFGAYHDDLDSAQSCSGLCRMTADTWAWVRARRRLSVSPYPRRPFVRADRKRVAFHILESSRVRRGFDFSPHVNLIANRECLWEFYDRGRACGAVALLLDDDWAYVDMLLVYRNHRRRGMARKMVARLKRHFRDRVCWEVPWESRFFWQRMPNLRWCENHRFAAFACPHCTQVFVVPDCFE